jgi:purine-nucleoside phosphorylase
MYDHIISSVNHIKAQTGGFAPEIGIILGTGLGGLVHEIEIQYTLPYESIPDFPVSTVEGHSGKLIFGMLGGKRIVAMQGRFHYYEGYSMQKVVLKWAILCSSTITSTFFLHIRSPAKTMNVSVRAFLI